jgi:hypothetical protein
MKPVFLVLSVVVTLASILPYLRDIMRGTTKPNLVSWLTWTLLTTVATAAEWAAGEYTAALFTGAASLETLSVVILGLKKGHVSYTRFDMWCQAGALAGLVLWWLFDSPAVAVMAAVSIDFIGGLPTFRHSWLAPGEETWQTYALSGLGGVFALLALSSYNWISLPYAVYIVAASFLIAGIIIFRRRATIQQQA